MAKSKQPLSSQSLEGRRLFRLDGIFKEFRAKGFSKLSEQKRSEKVNRALYELIHKEKAPCFLLSAVLEFIEKVDGEKILDHYTFASFELWLNQYSLCSAEENYLTRAKIAGKWVERSDYQALFPIAMGRVYEGSHFVTAHRSPDLDTTVASFWGWLDAFAARVADGLHLWNLPGGPPSSQIEIDWMFRAPLGNAVFTHLAKTRNTLNLTGNDLMRQKSLMKVSLKDSIASVDHDRDQKAVVITDEEGFYLGDWRSADVEGVRQVIILLSSCIRWFENHLHLQLISQFAKKNLSLSAVADELEKLFGMPIERCEPALEFSFQHRRQVDDLIRKVIGIKEGESTSFEKLISHLASLGKIPFEDCKKLLSSVKSLFDGKGKLLEDRPRIFQFLEHTVRLLHEAVFQIRQRLEKLDMALKAKYEVFGRHPTFVNARSDVEQIQSKIGSHLFLTVTSLDQGKQIPLGAISASDLRKSFLGTVSLRDFCNRDEMGIPSYLQVISVIDHHKSNLQTFSAPLAIIADVQSSNTLVAECAFQINDRYSLGGQTKEAIEKQIADLGKKQKISDSLFQRLLKRRQAAAKNVPFFIDPVRERLEYLHFLYAILDDTDLLTKVSAQDVECVVSLLNRIKTLSTGKEEEILSLEDLPRGPDFPKKAAKRILQNDEMYSLYQKVYAYREKEIERNLKLSADGKSSNIFADTKEQNGCCRVGQTKIFANNVSFFLKHANDLRRVWFEAASKNHQEKEEIDLHIHMVSTIVSAEEVYQGKTAAYSHKDELWIWVPQKELAIEHLKRFLTAFQASPGLKDNPMEVEFLGENAQELSSIFQESFISIPQTISLKKLPIAVLRVKAGSLNSRKAMISPFLPA